MNKKLSRTESDYIQLGCNEGIRGDGRGLHDFRTIQIENHIFPHTHGSSRIKIGQSTDVLCSVKLEISEPNLLTPKQGYLEFGIDISPSCNIRGDDRKVNDYATLICEHLQRLYTTSNALDFESLCIIEGKFCWVVYVDIIVLQSDSHLLQACSLAAYIALQSTLVPKVVLLPDESGALVDFDIVGDLIESIALQVYNVPIVIVACHVGGSLVLDPTADEITCSKCIFSIAYNQQGHCIDIVKQESGSFQLDQLPYIMKICLEASQSLFSYLNEYHTTLLKSGERQATPDAPPQRLSFLGF